MSFRWIFALVLLACAAEPVALPPLPPAPVGQTTGSAPPTSAEPQRIRARHILVAFQGAFGAPASLRRSREEAWERIHGLVARIEGGEDFASVARVASDDGSGAQGGDLGAVARGVMQADFEAAAFALPVGGRSAVLETPFGFHVIERTELVEVHLGQVYVPFTSEEGAALRTEAEALTQAEGAAAALRAGEPIRTVAPRFSEGPNASRGGDLGWFIAGELDPAFETVAFGLPPGGVSAPIRSAKGFHVLVRLEGGAAGG